MRRNRERRPDSHERQMRRLWRLDASCRCCEALVASHFSLRPNKRMRNFGRRGRFEYALTTSTVGGWPVHAIAAQALPHGRRHADCGGPIRRAPVRSVLSAHHSGGSRFRMRGGVISALSAILLYHVANPHLFTLKYEEPDLVQISLFLAVGMITAKMTRDADHLHRLAMTDDLTGLHNLRSFEARLITMVREARRTHATLAVLVLDLDRLKSLNDQYGHLTGAEAVRTVGRIW